MSRLLDHAIESVRALPPDAVARMLLQMAADNGSVIQLTAEKETDLAEADEEVARGEFASDGEMQATRHMRLRMNSGL